MLVGIRGKEEDGIWVNGGGNMMAWEEGVALVQHGSLGKGDIRAT